MPLGSFDWSSAMSFLNWSNCVLTERSNPLRMRFLRTWSHIWGSRGTQTWIYYIEKGVSIFLEISFSLPVWKIFCHPDVRLHATATILRVGLNKWNFIPPPPPNGAPWNLQVDKRHRRDEQKIYAEKILSFTAWTENGPDYALKK